MIIHPNKIEHILYFYSTNKFISSMISQSLINDSKFIQTLIEECCDNDFNEFNNSGIKELLNSGGKVNLLLVEKFYKNETIADSELLELFHSLNYLDCLKIKEIYKRISESMYYNELTSDITFVINNYLQRFKEIACGSFHSVGLREDGTVVTWGNNNMKQYENSPNKIDSLTNKIT